MMSNTQTLIIAGAKSAKGTFEDGKKSVSFDSTTVYIQVPLDDSQGLMAGYCTQEYKWGLSGNFDKIKHLEFPFEANVSFQTVSTGKSTKVVLTDIQPI